MGHVFVSYASADRERARQIATLVAGEGWDVWWDRTIPPGRQFDEVIEEALDAATCVVVLWSTASIASSWVKTEAAEANRRKMLIPVVIEDVKIPLEFRRLQAADLAGWKGERPHPEVDKFIAAIEREIGRPGGPRPIPRTIGGPASLPLGAVPVASAATALPDAHAPTLPQRLVDELPPVAHTAGASAGLKWTVGVVVLLLLAGSFAWYQSEQRSRQRENQAEQQRQELERKLEEGRRSVAAERDRLAKDLADQAERERAARDVLAKEKAAREVAEREAARRQAADLTAAQARARVAEESNARRPSEASSARSALPVPLVSPPPTSSAPLASVSSGLTWRDHALIFSGTLMLEGSGATLRAAITDLKNGRRIGGYSVPARISLRNSDRGEYFVQAEFDIPSDSTTPSPHTHQVGLIVRRQADGTLRMVQNCPQPGQCY